MHVPQSLEAQVELEDIAAIPYHIITPRHAKPLIGVYQDTLVGSYRLTRPGVNFTKREFMNLMMWNHRFDGTMPVARADGTKYTGQQILSALLPSVNIEMGNKAYDGEKDSKDSQNFVKIIQGDIKQGIIDDDIYMKPGKGIIHTTYNDYGPKETTQLLDALQNTVESFLVMNGFSVGISDLVADEDTKKNIDQVIQEQKKQVENLTLQVHTDLFENNTGKTNQQEFEDQVFGILNQATDNAGKAGKKSLSTENRLLAMVNSGSKGNTTNVAQMIACLGQQAIEGKRIQYGLTDRTLPHYKKYDDSAEARGFIESSFIRGLTPQEFFFHAMSGREGLIDTAVKSVTGDTPIVVLENGKTKQVPIGDWIDAQLDTALPGTVEHYEERDMELLRLTKPVYIPTADEDGVVSWGEITAITRHDPGKELYEIKTLAGKSVIVTESKSLLIYNEETHKFERMSTPDVRPGHYVPVTQELAAPPVETKSISVADYLPKTEYLYGSDFKIATLAVTEAMEGRDHIPAGWWNENNGKTFTLPYDSKAKFQRTLVRSETDNIKEGCVYPFHATREHSHMPSEFTLNKENGQFIGLFLAEGNADIDSGYVQITNNNATIREYAKKWFESHGITTSEDEKINKIGGKSTAIRGYSTLLAKFLTAIVGHTSYAKHVPAESFAAPEEFIVGLLDGYFSGDGTVSHNSVEVGSASEELINGISMLATRLGIFGKVFQTTLKSNNIDTKNIATTHRLSIRAQWAQKFASKITFIDEIKNESLMKMRPTDEHRNFQVQNNVVLDKILEINIIDVAKYPKVYDLTVPSTLNFGLANGLHVVDTAETGYIQRQLIKAMEDLVVQHDGTVRDANMNLMQFHYGEDGIMATKVENQSLPLGKLSQDDIRREFGMEGVDWSVILEDGTSRDNDEAIIASYVDALLDDQMMIVEGVFRGSALESGTVSAPVNLARMILNTKVRFDLKGENKTTLVPGYVLECIQKIILRTSNYHRIWIALLRFYLAPHKIIVKERFTKNAFDALCELIVVNHMKAWVQPGEQVGIVAAQSIGEPSTQMSAIGSTVICVTNGKDLRFYGSIKSFIDPILEKNKDKVTEIASDSVVLPLDDDYYIVGVSNDEKTSWKRISEISRHPANGGLVKVTTRSGRSTTATLSHSFLKRSKTGIVPVLGSDLKVGMRIPVAKEIPEVPGALTEITQGSTTFTLDKEFGWVCGIYLADGSFSGNTVKISKTNPIVEEKLIEFGKKYSITFSKREHEGEYGLSKDNNLYSKDLKDFLLATFKTGSYEKEIGSIVFHSNKEFIAGIISGYFDGDGNISVERQLIRASSRSEKLINQICALLGYCGLFGVISEETSVRIKDKVQHTLSIPRKFARSYRETIGFELTEKADALDKIIEYNDRDDAHDRAEYIDKIPELGEIIAETGRLLKMPGQSRTYGRWIKKESIGRRTLEQYVENFKGEALVAKVDAESLTVINSNIKVLESAINADVVWDEITSLEYLDDPKEYVYDFTVPGNDSFMVDCNVLVHNTLNTFHLAGVASKSNVTRGVPRLKELLKVSKNPKATSLTIYLKPEYRESKEKAREVVQDLELTLLRSITDKLAIYWEPHPESTVIEEDRKLLEFFRLYEDALKEGQEQPEEDVENKWVLRLELNKEEMFNKNISVADIVYIIKNTYPNVSVVYSDYNSEKLVMRLYVKNDDKTFATVMDEFSNLKKFQNNLLNTTVIRGVPGIKAVTFRKDKDKVQMQEGKYEPIEQYILDTDGSNYVKVMNHYAVDANRLYTTNVHDIIDILGLEATRAILYNEMATLFESVSVNYRHLGLLCDVITRSGRLMSIDRYGINKNDIGPLAKASFEETEKIMLKAAKFGEIDPVTGVSANIMMGQPIRGGTAFSQVILDETVLVKLLEGSMDQKDEEEEAVGDITEILEGGLHITDPCSTVQFSMNMSMPPQVESLVEPDIGITLIEK